jgi:hypothetical protein
VPVAGQRRPALSPDSSVKDPTIRFSNPGIGEARVVEGTLQQYAGRLHRQHAARTEVRSIDLVDSLHGTRPGERPDVVRR